MTRFLLLCACLTVGAAPAPTPAPMEVAQRGRRFDPATLSVRRGDTVQFVNDDGVLLHHAFLIDDAFSFDIGEQTPGARTPVRFTTSGQFMVLCGIHPKMKLAVAVAP